MRRRAFLAALPPVLAACAPAVQLRGDPGPDFLGPRLEQDRFVSFDGTSLPLNVWPAPADPWAVVVGVHGFNDYAAAFVLAAPEWAKQGITTYAWDQRGFGRAPQRGVWPGEPLMLEDLRTITALVRARHPGAVLAVVGESMGGAVAINAFASDRPPQADRLVLSAPGVWGLATMPWVYRSTLWLGAHTIGGRVLTAPRRLRTRAKASDNIEHLRRMGRDPHMIFPTRVDAIFGLANLMQRALVRAGEVRRPPPLLYCYGAHDRVIPKAPTVAAVRRLKPEDRTAYYEDGWHLLTRDLERAKVIADVAAFIRDPHAPLPSGAPAIPHDLKA